MTRKIIFIVISLLVFCDGCWWNPTPPDTTKSSTPDPDSVVDNLKSAQNPYCCLFITITSPNTIFSKVTNANYVSYLLTDTISAKGYNSLNPYGINWFVKEDDGLGNEKNDPNGMSNIYNCQLPGALDIADYDKYRDKNAYKISIANTYSSPEIPGHGSAALVLQQDNVDDLRQEYLDVFHTREIDNGVTPARQEFDNYQPQNTGLVVSNICGRHRWHIVKELDGRVSELLSYLEGKGISMTVTCGYRCPVGNRNHAGRSEHMYGIAFDWDAGDATNYKVYEYVKAKYIDPKPVIILYDQDETQYFFPSDQKGKNDEVIPDEYDPETSDIIFGHGHIDWRNF